MDNQEVPSGFDNEYNNGIDDNEEQLISTTSRVASPKRKRAFTKQDTLSVKGRRTSAVWNHFTFTTLALGGFEVHCKYCKTYKFIYDSIMGTSNAKRHYLKCPSYLEFMSKNPNGLAGTDFDQKTYLKLFAQSILGHGYPLRMAEHPRTRRLHDYLNPNVKTVCRNTMTKCCMSEYNDLKKQLFDTLGASSSRICLTSDLWQACTINAYLVLTAHYVDNNWKLRSKILNFQHFESSHTGNNIYEFVQALIREWGIEKKAFTITVDNATNMDVFAARLECDLNACSPLPLDGRYFHIRCCAHILNIIVQEGLRVIDGCIEKVREGVKYITFTEGRKIKFKQCVVATNSDFKLKLKKDVSTRWNSTFLMLERALLAKEALDMFAKRDGNYKFGLSDLEWQHIQSMSNFLEPFYLITKLFFCF
ncbi:zinc finger BED domain-containing protein RICESLEEPER 2-like [Spinacia oleracea]|uniref:Zinc finger BED domain-containing protein RICESLEEPER 2-like n=1 Tax=Spinacia oleracea TaxID=3562 RepID=A0A9R0HSU9_SPIOL|nr:zinc finger BED domain-containing protein RICESLEEPER 2-like [Spinacia oleracea]